MINQAEFFLSHRKDLARAILAKGYSFVVAVPESQAVAEVRQSGFKVISYSASRSGLNPIREFHTFLSLYALLRRTQPDLVHFFTSKPMIYGGIAARLLRTPKVIHSVTGLGYVFTETTPSTRLLRIIIRILYRASLSNPRSRVIFQNPDDQRIFNEFGLVDRERSILIAGSGINLGLFKHVPESANGAPIILLPARMLWNKGIGEFVDAARMLKRENIVARFVLAGGIDSENPASISEAKLLSWSAEGMVEWIGHQSDMATLFAESTIVCLPSYREGTPRALLEAMASGRPIVTTSVPGCRELVEEGKNGILVEPRNVDSLAGAIRTLLSSNKLRKQMGDQGRRIAEERYSIATLVQKTFAVYNHSK